MKRELLTLVLAAVCGALVSCSKTNDPPGGSQTHFLKSCEQSCAAPYSCLCGVCTLPCTEDATCTTHFGAAECVAPVTDGADCEGAAAQVCDAACAQTSDCAALGEQFACVGGRCRTASIIPEAGRSGGESGQAGAGSSGTGTGTAGSAAGTQAGQSGAGTAGTGASTMQAALCNGSSDDAWLWIGSAGGGPLEATFPITNPHGHSYLLIDRKCRYYVFREIMVGTKTGTLTPNEAETIASDVGYHDLPAWDGHMDAPCPDAGEQFIARAGARVYCSCGCDEQGPAGLGDAMRAASEWSATLAERGADMDGPIAAIASIQMMPPIQQPPIPWPLSRQIPIIPGFVQDANAPEMPVIFAADEAEQLRALRAEAHERPQSFNRAFVEDGSGTYDVFMHDVLPDAVLQSMSTFPPR